MATRLLEGIRRDRKIASWNRQACLDPSQASSKAERRFAGRKFHERGLFTRQATISGDAAGQSAEKDDIAARRARNVTVAGGSGAYQDRQQAAFLMACLDQSTGMAQ
jgi:hypothetical protein